MDAQRWQYLRARVLLVSADDIRQLRNSGEMDESVTEPGWVGRVSYQDKFVSVDRLLDQLGNDGWELVAAVASKVPVVFGASPGPEGGDGRPMRHIDVVQDYLFKRPRVTATY